MRFHSATYIPAPRVLRCPGMILALLTALLFSGARLSAQDGSTAYNYLNVTSSARISPEWSMPAPSESAAPGAPVSVISATAR